MRSTIRVVVAAFAAAIALAAAGPGLPAAPGAEQAQVATPPVAVPAPRPAAADIPRRRTTRQAERPRPVRRGPVFTLVRAAAGAVVRARPGGRVVGELPGRTPIGAVTWLWAQERTADGRWGRVALPWRPNGRTGWVDLRRHRTVESRVWVHADLSRREVTLLRGREVVRRFTASVGAPVSPTPTGRFSVTDLVATGDPNGYLGWFAFGLTGHQPNLPPGWVGGDQLAIHGTNDPSSFGRAASAGCLRVSAQALGVLKRLLRLGTPVVIDR
jgi:lipoprotein-anchoring transpeptidase ErfK/SrfK